MRFSCLVSAIESSLGWDIKLDRVKLFGRCYHSVLCARYLRTEICWVIFFLPVMKFHTLGGAPILRELHTNHPTAYGTRK